MAPLCSLVGLQTISQFLEHLSSPTGPRTGVPLGLGGPAVRARVQGREAGLAMLRLEWSASRFLSAVTIMCYWRAEGDTNPSKKYLVNAIGNDRNGCEN